MKMTAVSKGDRTSQTRECITVFLKGKQEEYEMAGQEKIPILNLFVFLFHSHILISLA